MRVRIRTCSIREMLCVLAFTVGCLAFIAQVSANGSAPLYTTDAEISPFELFTWEAVYTSKPTMGVLYIVAENPLFRTPVDCLVEYVLERLDYERGKLTGYAYYIDAKLYVYELQPKDDTLSSGHFAQVEVTEDKRKIIDYYLLKFLRMDRV